MSQELTPRMATDGESRHAPPSRPGEGLSVPAVPTAKAGPDRKRDLLHAATDLYLGDPNPSETSRDHYTSIAGHALPHMSDRDRAFYANRVAAEPTLPQPVAQKLAGDDDIAVAQLVLKLSPVLTDEDLTAIALTHSQEHLIAIAERAAIAEITTEVLADRGNLNVLRTLSGNAGARFNDRGMSLMVSRGGQDPHVSSNLNERAMEKRERQAQRVLRIAVQTEQEEGDIVQSGRRRQQHVHAMIADVLKGRRPLGDVVACVAEDDRAFDLAVVLATFGKIAPAQALRALLAPDLGPIATICRSVGLPVDAFATVLKLRAIRLKQDEVEIRRDRSAYERLLEAKPEPGSAPGDSRSSGLRLAG